MDLFKESVTNKYIQFHGILQEIIPKYRQFIDTLYKTEWVVYLKESFASPEAFTLLRLRLWRVNVLKLPDYIKTEYFYKGSLNQFFQASWDIIVQINIQKGVSTLKMLKNYAESYSKYYFLSQICSIPCIFLFSCTSFVKITSEVRYEF